MKMKDKKWKWVKDLPKGLTRGNLYNKRQGKIKGNKNPQEIFYESTNNLFNLLAHHPFFVEQVAIIRRKHNLPFSKITNAQEFLEWKSLKPKAYTSTLNDPEIEVLISGFNFAPELKKSVRQFTSDFIMTNDLIFPSMFETGLNIIKYSEKQKTLKLNPKSIYLEITPFTTNRELKVSWDKIAGKRREIRNYGVPNYSKIEERVWELSHFEKSNLKSISQKIKEEMGISYDSWQIAKFKNKYKNYLSKLRPLK